MNNTPPNTPILDIKVFGLEGGGAQIEFQYGALRMTSEIDEHTRMRLAQVLLTDRLRGVRQVPAETSLPITGFFCPHLPSPTKYFSLTTEQLNPRRTI